MLSLPTVPFSFASLIHHTRQEKTPDSWLMPSERKKKTLSYLCSLQQIRLDQPLDVVKVMLSLHERQVECIRQSEAVCVCVKPQKMLSVCIEKKKKMIESKKQAKEAGVLRMKGHMREKKEKEEEEGPVLDVLRSWKQNKKKLLPILSVISCDVKVGRRKGKGIWGKH